jgi:hypothetical protein
MITARDIVEQWLKENQSLIGVPPSEWKRSDQYAETFHTWYETKNYLLDLTCWNYAYCLDIFAMNKITGDQEFGVSGACEGEIGLRDRLSSFMIWLEGANLNTEPAHPANPRNAGG